MDKDISENEPAGAQVIDIPLGSTAPRADTPPSISVASLQTQNPREIASTTPDPPSLAWDTSLPRRPTSRPAMELPAEHMIIDGRAQGPKKQSSIADCAAQAVKDIKTTATMATSPLPVEESSPEALRSDKEEPVEDGEDGVLFRGRPPGAPQRSNVAAFFWSRLELAYSLFRERRLDECRELILISLEKAHVPLACRCQLLQQLAVIEPYDHGMECLEEADELCRQMRRIVPDSEQLDKMENRTSLFRGLLEERHKAIGEDEEMAEDDDITSDEDEEMIMDDDNDTKAGEESKESQSVQQQSDHEMEEEGLGEISKIGRLNLHGAAEDTFSSLPENALPRRRQTTRPSVLGLMTPEASMREEEDEADQGQADMQ